MYKTNYQLRVKCYAVEMLHCHLRVMHQCWCETAKYLYNLLKTNKIISLLSYLSQHQTVDKSLCRTSQIVTFAQQQFWPNPIHKYLKRMKLSISSQVQIQKFVSSSSLLCVYGQLLILKALMKKQYLHFQICYYCLMRLSCI